jgi:pyruvate dehydrogenase E2 component (dihydrolipoamide acetyltransferase)
MQTFRMPDVGEGLTEAEIVRWFVEPGEQVDVNQIVCEIETAKALVELPCPFEGTVAQLHATTGEIVPVGGDLISVETADEPPTREPVLVGYGTSNEKPVRRRRRPTTPQGTQTPEAGPPGAETKPVRHGGYEVARSTEERLTTEQPRPRTKPPVRKLAKELGIDLAAVDPTGPGAVITRADVERAAAQRQSAPTGSEQIIPVRGVMRSMAKAMVDSAFSAPHVTEWLDVEVGESLRLLDRLRERHPDHKWSPTVLAAHALVTAAVKHPRVNATFDAEAEVILVHPAVHLGLAVATERGLLVPRVANVNTMSLVQLAGAIGTTTEAARAGTLPPADLTGSTISLTNVGVFGVDGGTPILPPGQVAILCLGRVVERPWVVNGQIAVRPVVTLTLSFDHRCVDGQLGSQVLSEVAQFLHDPAVGMAG